MTAGTIGYVQLSQFLVVYGGDITSYDKIRFRGKIRKFTKFTT